jgi:hypothetical protein
VSEVASRLPAGVRRELVGTGSGSMRNKPLVVPQHADVGADALRRHPPQLLELPSVADLSPRRSSGEGCSVPVAESTSTGELSLAGAVKSDAGTTACAELVALSSRLSATVADSASR